MHVTDNFPPSMIGYSTVRVTVGIEFVYNFSVTETKGDNFTVELAGGLPSNSALSDDGNGNYTFRWLLLEPTTFELIFTATDSKGAASSLNPNVEVCACKNGTCTTLGQGLGSTSIMSCDCHQGLIARSTGYFNVF